MKALVIGGGVAGCTVSHRLKEEGWDVTILEKNDGVGGMSRTYFYNGHPYEFGPHVWFWPKDRENDLILKLADGGMHEVDRKLYTFTGEGFYRYPVHANDISTMPNSKNIWDELMKYRDDTHKLDYDRLPTIGQCKFSEYFIAAIGEPLYNDFMKEYTHKMWGIPGDELETCMVWADRMKDIDATVHYDPIKWDKQHNLGKGLGNWYPKSPKGWNVVWENMVKDCTVKYGVDKVSILENGSTVVIVDYKDGEKEVFLTRDYDSIIVTIHPDLVFDEFTLPATGRMIIPLLIPETNKVYLDGIESIHYSDNSPITRTTEMKTITRHESHDSLLLVEVPIDGTHNHPIVPENIAIPQHYQRRCYARQTNEAIALHKTYVERLKTIDQRIRVCGRHGKFQYWGMPQTVEDGLNVAEEVIAECS